jgi:hypothetical protein
MRPAIRPLLCSAVLALSACGGGNETESTSFDRSALLGDLSDAQYGSFCDWAVAQLGGEGATYECPLEDQPQLAVELTVRKTSQCLSDTPPACTGSAVEQCMDALGSDLCGLKDEPACAGFRACFASWPEMGYLLDFQPPPPSNGASSDNYWK